MGVIQPPEATNADLLRAYWWSERQAPGSKAPGTTFIFGHSCHTGCPAVFNTLQTIHLGALATVITPKGQLTYQAFRKHPYPADSVSGSSEIYKDVPGRLVLATCKLRQDGGIQTDRIVVWFKLVAARSVRSN